MKVMPLGRPRSRLLWNNSLTGCQMLVLGHPLSRRGGPSPAYKAVD